MSHPIPFSSTFISRDAIPRPHTFGQHTQYMKGTSYGSSGPRKNCCWIEVSMHAILSEPFLRYFILDSQRKEKYVVLPSNVTKEYACGAKLCQYLYWRWTESNIDQEEWDHAHDRMMAAIRVDFATLANDDVNGLGSGPELVVSMMTCIRVYIASVYKDQLFARLFRSYAYPITCSDELKCTKQLCKFSQQSIGTYTDSNVNTNDMTTIDEFNDFHLMIPVSPVFN